MANFQIDIDINNDMIYQSLLENNMTIDERIKMFEAILSGIDIIDRKKLLYMIVDRKGCANSELLAECSEIIFNY